MSSTAIPSSRCRRLEQLEDLRLNGDVERGGRLVGDEDLRMADEGHRDHDALAHPARELVRVVINAVVRLGDAHLAQQLDRPRPRRRCATAAGARSPLRRPGPRSSAPGSARSSAPGRSSRCGCRGPRGARAGASVSRLRPSNSMRLPGRNGPGGSGIRRRIESEVTVLPQPDSPTTPERLTREEVEGDAVHRPRGAAALSVTK